MWLLLESRIWFGEVVWWFIMEVGKVEVVVVVRDVVEMCWIFIVVVVC